MEERYEEGGEDDSAISKLRVVSGLTNQPEQRSNIRYHIIQTAGCP